jgi:hypothetical protein
MNFMLGVVVAVGLGVIPLSLLLGFLPYNSERRERRSWYPLFGEATLGVVALGRWTGEHWIAVVVLLALLALNSSSLIQRFQWRAHLLAVIVAIIPSFVLRHSLRSIYVAFGHNEQQFAISFIGLAVATVLGSAVVSCTLRILSKKIGLQVLIGMLGGGSVIGVLERTIVFGSVLAHHPEAAALVVLVKSIARFPELSASNNEASKTGAEFFIIGTLLSLLVALAAGYLVLFALHMHG